MIRNTALACQRSGMPLEHARVFQRVANDMKCMIASRSVGRYATGLILEDYATKGFHVKTKSCNFGPMAGFVLSDPRFSKRGQKGVESQRKATHAAFAAGADEMPVFISEARRRDLEGPLNCMTLIRKKDINTYIYESRGMRFVLERALGAPGAAGKQLWAVKYGKSETAMPGRLKSPAKADTGGNRVPVMALVDPMCTRQVRGTYRAAMTGDYDLWGIWPAAASYQPQKADRRPVPQSDRRVLGYKAFKAEDPHLGNITGRGKRVRTALNTGIQAAGYGGGNMVHHSDETGRPQVFEVELEFIAFVPGQSDARFIDTMADYRELMRECLRDYSISLNGAWQRALGFGASRDGAYTWDHSGRQR